MQLYHPFPQEVRGIYSHDWYCFDCGSYNMVTIHHICGRKKMHPESASKFNSIPLCHDCHVRVLQNEPTIIKYLKKTAEFMRYNSPNKKQIDHDFIKVNAKYYEHQKI